MCLELIHITVQYVTGSGTQHMDIMKIKVTLYLRVKYLCALQKKKQNYRS
jgi:hypothetical protein